MVWIRAEKKSRFVEDSLLAVICASSDENVLFANAFEEHRVRLELVSVMMEGSEKTGP